MVVLAQVRVCGERRNGKGSQIVVVPGVEERGKRGTQLSAGLLVWLAYGDQKQGTSYACCCE
ncbi:hypothetical protein EYF80_007701 [Liparis tanakae]|uniref:Uncharacterized protein n=1 Tax=Liparis tanakae TaxID=230148 RepID=A0A4Z2IVR8_9TELE|nr:hypothetical protein EYF80_007701 [Liparis tanakae]